MAKKSRTFFSFPCSADEQVGRSWEGAQPGSQPKLAMEIFHTMDGMFSLRMGVGQGAGTLSPGFDLFCEFEFFFCEFGEFCEIRKFCDRCSGTGCAVSCRVVRKIVLCMACFAYSLTIVFFVLLNCLYLHPQILLFVHSPPRRTERGQEGVSNGMVLVAGCQVKPWPCLRGESGLVQNQGFKLASANERYQDGRLIQTPNI